MKTACFYILLTKFPVRDPIHSDPICHITTETTLNAVKDKIPNSHNSLGLSTFEPHRVT